MASEAIGSLSGKRVAVYARYSTDRQNAGSVADQIAKLARWAAQQGGELRDALTFSDEAMSGAVRERPGLLALVRAAEEGRVDVVLAEDLGRLSRDVEDCAWFRKRLAHHEVRLIAIDDGIDTASEGAELMGDVMAGFKALYRREVAKKTQRGMEAKARAGLSTGGLPYGYRSVECAEGKRIEVDAERAETVRRIFALSAEGAALRTIAGTLNAEGIRPPRGSRSSAEPSWQATTVRSILRNPRYAGRWTFGRLQWTRDPDTRRRRPRARSEALVTIERPELRIVDAAIFDAVVSRLALVKDRYARDAPRARRREHLLSGLLVCDVCSSPMHVHGGNATRRYYRCSRAGSRGTCSNMLSACDAVIRPLFLGALEKRLSSPAAQRAIRNAIAEELRHASTGAEGERERIVARIDHNRKRAARLVAAIADGAAVSGIVSAIAEHEAQIRADERALSELAEPSALEAPPLEAIAEAVTSLRGLEADPRRGRETLRRWLVDGAIRMKPKGNRYVMLAGVLPTMLVSGLSNASIAGANKRSDRNVLRITLEVAA